jgi:membrane protein YdbS with pleckstrin-like domain
VVKLVPSSDTVPRSITRILLPLENRHVICVRRHPAILIRPILEVLAGLAIAGFLSSTVAGKSGVVVAVLWIAWGLLVLRLGLKVWAWIIDYFIVTPKRMLMTTGIFNRKVAMMPMSKVTDMSFQRTQLGRMLGYGEFILESAGQDQALRVVDHLPYPEQLYQQVCEVLFPGMDGDDDD